MEQGSAEWFAARAGKVTASRVADVVSKTKSGEASSARAAYQAELIAERLTGRPTPVFKARATDWGKDHEGLARLAYEFFADVTVEQVGLIDHPRIDFAAASPDGLIGEDGTLEIKCPNTSTHIDVLMAQAVPKMYLTQIAWQQACTSRDWTDFVSFDPRMPPRMQLYVKRVERDQALIDSLEREVAAFLREVDDKVSRLRAL